jgi:hypothetical protein
MAKPVPIQARVQLADCEVDSPMRSLTSFSQAVDEIVDARV